MHGDGMKCMQKGCDESIVHGMGGTTCDQINQVNQQKEMEGMVVLMRCVLMYGGQLSTIHSLQRIMLHKGSWQVCTGFQGLSWQPAVESRRFQW